MLVRYQRALAAYVSAIILMVVIFYGTINLQNLLAVIFSAIGVIMVFAAALYAFSR